MGVAGERMGLALEVELVGDELEWRGGGGARWPRGRSRRRRIGRRGACLLCGGSLPRRASRTTRRRIRLTRASARWSPRRAGSLLLGGRGGRRPWPARGG